jgi:outer membrane protein TolC
VLTAYSGMQTATRRVRTSTDLLASAQQSEEVALARYREGVGSIVDLLLAQSALADARAQSIQSRWQWRQALVQLSHDVGTLGIHGEPILTPNNGR